jgi:hypothetical protein
VEVFELIPGVPRTMVTSHSLYWERPFLAAGSTGQRNTLIF